MAHPTFANEGFIRLDGPGMGRGGQAPRGNVPPPPPFHPQPHMGAGAPPRPMPPGVRQTFTPHQQQHPQHAQPPHMAMPFQQHPGAAAPMPQYPPAANMLPTEPPTGAVPQRLRKPDRPAKDVEISDLRGEGLTAENFRDKCTDFYVCRFEKIAAEEGMIDDVTGEKYKATWQNAKRTKVDDLSRNDIRKAIAELDKRMPLRAHKEELSSNQKRQIEKKRQDLEVLDVPRDDRFEIILVQLHSEFRDLTEKEAKPYFKKFPKLAAAHEARKKEKKDSKKDKKDRKEKTDKDTKVKVRVAITAYYKRWPKVGVNAQEIVEERDRKKVEKEHLTQHLAREQERLRLVDLQQRQHQQQVNQQQLDNQQQQLHIQRQQMQQQHMQMQQQPMHPPIRPVVPQRGGPARHHPGHHHNSRSRSRGSSSESDSVFSEGETESSRSSRDDSSDGRRGRRTPRGPRGGGGGNGNPHHYGRSTSTTRRRRNSTGGGHRVPNPVPKAPAPIIVQNFPLPQTAPAPAANEDVNRAFHDGRELGREEQRRAVEEVIARTATPLGRMNSPPGPRPRSASRVRLPPAPQPPPPQPSVVRIIEVPDNHNRRPAAYESAEDERERLEQLHFETEKQRLRVQAAERQEQEEAQQRSYFVVGGGAAPRWNEHERHYYHREEDRQHRRERAAEHRHAADARVRNIERQAREAYDDRNRAHYRDRHEHRRHHSRESSPDGSSWTSASFQDNHHAPNPFLQRPPQPPVLGRRSSIYYRVGGGRDSRPY